MSLLRSASRKLLGPSEEKLQRHLWYARLCALAYHDDEERNTQLAEQAETLPFLELAEVELMFSIRMVLFVRTDSLKESKKRTYVVAVRGTDPGIGRNLAYDAVFATQALLQWLISHRGASEDVWDLPRSTASVAMTKPMDACFAAVQAWMKEYDADSKHSWVVTGHSIGGFLAESLAVRLKIPGVTFMSPHGSRSSHLDHYIVDTDYVSALHKRGKNTSLIQSSDMFPQSHGIQRFCNTVTLADITAAWDRRGHLTNMHGPEYDELRRVVSENKAVLAAALFALLAATAVVKHAASSSSNRNAAATSPPRPPRQGRAPSPRS